MRRLLRSLNMSSVSDAMNIRNEAVPTENSPRNMSVLWVVLLCCVVPALAISSQSYWIDEALTAAKASSPTLAMWWERMATEKASDLQMPLYMLTTWGVAQLFGTAEWVLRAANLPWFAAGLMAFTFSFRGRQRILAAAVGALSPFAWFYLDEARPYAMQLGASLLVAASIRQLTKDAENAAKPTTWLAFFAIGIGVLAGTSLLGVFWCFAAVLMLVWMKGWGGSLQWLRTARVACACLALWICFLGAYYAWTLKVGARASAMATTNWQSPLFVVYELMGFSGLGPGRLEIRAAGFSAFKSCLVPLVIYGSVIASVMMAGTTGWWRRSRNETLKVGLVMIATLLCLVAAGLLLHFRVLGRHCAPALPVVLVLLIEGVWIVGKWRGAAMISVMVVLTTSCLSARFAERHLKDDYRAAATRGREAAEAGKTVWWSADAQAAEFYGLQIAAEQTNGATVRLVLNPDDAALADAALPDIVICSKPDLYDVHGALGRKMVAGGFVETTNHPAFRVLQRAQGK